jgi:hypothetical protein
MASALVRSQLRLWGVVASGWRSPQRAFCWRRPVWGTSQWAFRSEFFDAVQKVMGSVAIEIIEGTGLVEEFTLL